MNSFVVRLFVFINEVLSTLLIGLVLIAGLLLMSKSFVLGLSVALGGTIIFSIIFGFAALIIEIHKDLRFMRENSVAKNLSKN